MPQYRIHVSVSTIVEQVIEVNDAISLEDILGNRIFTTLADYQECSESGSDKIYLVEWGDWPGDVVGKVLSQTTQDCDASLEIISAILLEDREEDNS